MSGVNKVMLLGRVKQPTIKQHPDGTWVCFTVITSEVISKIGTEQDYFHEVRIAQGNPVLKYRAIKAGELVYLEGILKTRFFIDQQNIKRYKTEVIAMHIDWHS